MLVFPSQQLARKVIADTRIRILTVMRFDLRQLPEPSPPPIKEPPDGPENPDVPVREPDPDEPFQMSGMTIGC